MEDDRRELLYKRILDDEFTWENIVVDIVREEGIDPWDIDISRLTRAYISRIKELKELNFRVSGKILLIAAFLLRMKSKQFAFEEEDSERDETRVSLLDDIHIEISDLEPRIPLPKTRKVTLQELISALDSALIVKQRKETRLQRMRMLQERRKFKHDFKGTKITERLTALFDRLRTTLKRLRSRTILFSRLTPSKERDDLILTFIPLVILANKGKVELKQETCFGEIVVGLLDETDLDTSSLQESNETRQ